MCKVSLPAAVGLLGLLLAGCATLDPRPAGSSAATASAAGSAECAAPPLGETRLYLRGAMSGWAAVEEYALVWDCSAYAITSELRGAQDFKIADSAWSTATIFAAPDGTDADGAQVPVARADRGGSHNLRFRFDGWSRIRLAFDGERPVLTVEAAPARPEALSDSRARSIRHDSRDLAHKSPFGAVPDGTEVAFALDAPAEVGRATLVVETRRLEGNQEILDYAPLARVPLSRGSDGRWSGRFRFEGAAVYGYWFEAELGGRTFVHQNNSAPIYWTRERGANGEGVTTDAPADPAAVRRFRLTVHARDHAVPDWAQTAVWYYVFPERFRNGDPSNDPKPGPNTFQDRSVEVHRAWTERPFRAGLGDGSDPHYSNDFFGGDLAGVIEKLDHVAALGATALYMTPIFEASSNHKYDHADYRRVDPGFGTNADFERLTREAGRRGIRVVVDASFNHSGRDSVYFDRFGKYPGVGALEGGVVRPDSPYADWYRLDASKTDPDDMYVGWTGAKDLPELNEASPSLRAFAYGAEDSVTRRWLDLGAAGWRMDVAPWVPDDFFREWRKAVKAHSPDAVTISETWFDASKHLLGDTFDGTMNYVFRNVALDIAAGGHVADNYRNIELMREFYPAASLRASMNLLSTHDTARSLWLLGERGDDPSKAAEAKRRYLLAVMMQVAWPGAPTVYYGDEVGLTGGEDPDNRRTFPWADQGGTPDLALMEDVRRLLALRKAHPVLARGELGPPLHADDHVVVATRTLGDAAAVVAVNNAAEAKVVEVRLPKRLGDRAYLDADTGARLTASGSLTLTLPALSGRIFVAAP